MLQRRLFLLEHEVDGLLKRKINFNLKDHVNGTRILDYGIMLNEKENQVIELERKIKNLEAKLAKAALREHELEN